MPPFGEAYFFFAQHIDSTRLLLYSYINLSKGGNCMTHLSILEHLAEQANLNGKVRTKK